MGTIDDLKNNAELILQEWVDGMIDSLASANPRITPVTLYLKRGCKNYVAQHMDQVRDIINKAAIFVLDDGKLDADNIYNDAVKLFELMPETQFSKGFISGTIGQGAIRIILPEGVIWSILFGDVGSIKITADDFASLRDLIKQLIHYNPEQLVD